MLYYVALCLVLPVGVGIFQIFEGGCKRLQKKKRRKKASHVVGKPLGSFKTLHEKKLYRKLMQILNDYTHPVTLF